MKSRTPFLLAIGLSIFSATSPVSGADSSRELAERTGGHVLLPGEVALVRKSLPKKKSFRFWKTEASVPKKIKLPSGRELTLPDSESTDVWVMIPYREGGASIVPANNPDVVIIDDSQELTPSPSKISSNLTSSVARGKTTRVLITLNDSSSKPNRNGNLRESPAMDNLRSQLTGMLRKPTSAIRSLPIVNSIAVTDVNASDLKFLSQNPSIKRISPDSPVHTFLDSSPQIIKADYAWSTPDSQGNYITGKQVTIAVIDTGVDYTHSDLGGCLGTTCKVKGGYDFVNFDNDPMDDHGHGTHCASTAAGNGVLKGIAPDSRILAYKVLNAQGAGWTSDVIAGIQAAMDPNGDGDPSDHADVISMSLGGTGNPDDLGSLAIDAATAVGVTSAVAAGNSGNGPSTINSPGTARTAITVAASCKPTSLNSNSYCMNGAIASFSSRGPLVWIGDNLSKPDIAAPGVAICAARSGNAFSTEPTCIDSAHVRLNGTSMATPHIAGVIALLKQIDPSLTPEQIKLQLKSTATPLGTNVNAEGAGLVNVQAAMPATSSIAVSPYVSSFVSNPTQHYSTHSSTLTVNPINLNTAVTLTLALSPPTPGITLQSSKPSITVGPGASDSVVNTLTIDNDLATSGNHVLHVELRDPNQVVLASQVVYVNVTPTIRFTNSTVVDFGVDPPSDPSYADSENVTVENRRLDGPQVVSFSSSGFPNGSSIAFSPTSISIPAGTTATTQATLNVVNAQVANGIYSGGLVVSSSTGFQGSTQAKFVKYFVMSFEDLLETPYLLSVHNKVDSSVFLAPSNKKTEIYTTKPGSYDATIVYLDFSPNVSFREVFIENIAVSGAKTTVPISRNTAIYNWSSAFTLKSGSSYVPSTVAISNTYKPKPYVGGFFIGLSAPAGSGFDATPFAISGVSSNYSITKSYPTTQDAYGIYEFSDGSDTGVNSSTVFSNTPSTMPSTPLTFNINNTPPNTMSKFNFIDSRYATISSDLPIDLSGPSWIKNLYYYRSPLYTGEYNSTYLYANTSRIGCNPTGWCPDVFLSPIFDVSSTRRNTIGFQPLPSRTTPLVSIGMGPSVWLGRFDNTPYSIEFLGTNGSPIQDLIFARQDFSLGEYPSIPITVQNKLGTLVGTSAYPEFVIDPNLSNLSNFPNPAPAVPISAPKGAHLVKFEYPYQIEGQNYMGYVEATVHPSATYKNPPAIRRFSLYADGEISEVYSTIRPVYAEIEATPVGNAINAVKLFYSLNGGSFKQMTPIIQGNVYRFNLPALAKKTGIINFRVDLSDANGNRLKNTFAVPIYAK